MSDCAAGASRNAGGTVEKPVQDQGGRKGSPFPRDHSPPLVLLTGETACPTKTGDKIAGATND